MVRIPGVVTAITVPMVSTFSVCAIDPGSGVVGAAVASRYVAVGSLVPHVRAGVGVILTQSIANPLFGPRGLDLLERGDDPQDVLAALLTDDPHREIRQVGVLGPNGTSALWSGPQCVPEVGEDHASGVLALGNSLAGTEVAREMVRVCTEHLSAQPAESRDLREAAFSMAEALITALVAGEAAGGDRRGRQAAAVLVKGPGAGYQGNGDTAVDLRVDDHQDPLRELGRIFGVLRALHET